MPVPRRSREETKQLMLDAGVEVLLRDGISVGAATFRYPDAFALLADEQGTTVTRGSVHERIWSSQEAWQLDVLSESIRRNEGRRRVVIAEAVTEHLVDLPTETAAERLHVLAEACRVGSLTFIDQVADTPSYRLFPTLVAAWRASPDGLPEHISLGEILRQFQQLVSKELVTNITTLIDYLGLVAHPARRLDQAEAIRAYCAATTSLANSQTMRLPHDPALSRRISARSPNGETNSWNLLGLGSWLIASALFVDRTNSEVSP